MEEIVKFQSYDELKRKYEERLNPGEEVTYVFIRICGQVQLFVM